jgi:SAM-dependent methyltransferase
MDSRPCPACSADAARPVGSANGHALARCARCRTLFTASLPASPAEAIDYAGYYHEANLRVPEFVERRLEEVVGEFEPYRRSGRWLDVGCGAGALMRAATRQGWSAVGTEMGEGAAEAVRAGGFEVHVGELEALGLEEESFDVVSLVEVIEHVDDPGQLVRDARRLVRPGGALYVTTPHARGISARLLRNRWSAVGPPEHLQLFSLAGLRVLMERADLDVRWARTHAVNPHELLAALRRQGDQTGGERVETGYSLNESLSGSRRGQAVKSAANAVLNATRLGDAIKLAAERPA